MGTIISSRGGDHYHALCAEWWVVGTRHQNFLNWACAPDPREKCFQKATLKHFCPQALQGVFFKPRSQTFSPILGPKPSPQTLGPNLLPKPLDSKPSPQTFWPKPSPQTFGQNLLPKPLPKPFPQTFGPNLLPKLPKPWILAKTFANFWAQLPKPWTQTLQQRVLHRVQGYLNRG